MAFFDKINWLPLSIFATFQLCYLEWAGNNSMFVAEIQYTIFTNYKNYFDNFLHPIILLGLIAQSVIVVSIFIDKFYKKWFTWALTTLTLLVIFLFIIGLLSTNLKIIFSSIPFLILAFWYFYQKKLPYQTRQFKD